MNILGVEIKSKEVFLTVLNPQTTNISNLKLKLKNDDDKDDIQALFDEIKNICTNNEIVYIFIKKRLKKGKMAASAESFKIETLFQLMKTEFLLFDNSTINNFVSNNEKNISYPKQIQKQYLNSFLCAFIGLKKINSNIF